MMSDSAADDSVRTPGPGLCDIEFNLSVTVTESEQSFIGQ